MAKDADAEARRATVKVNLSTDVLDRLDRMAQGAGVREGSR